MTVTYIDTPSKLPKLYKNKFISKLNQVSIMILAFPFPQNQQSYPLRDMMHLYLEVMFEARSDVRHLLQNKDVTQRETKSFYNSLLYTRKLDSAHTANKKIKTKTERQRAWSRSLSELTKTFQGKVQIKRSMFTSKACASLTINASNERTQSCYGKLPCGGESIASRSPFDMGFTTSSRHNTDGLAIRMQRILRMNGAIA